jgi:hypothetical protein
LHEIREIKQYLRIKRFFGTSENAVKTRIWVAGCICVPVARIKKQLKLSASQHTTPSKPAG